MNEGRKEGKKKMISPLIKSANFNSLKLILVQHSFEWISIFQWISLNSLISFVAPKIRISFNYSSSIPNVCVVWHPADRSNSNRVGYYPLRMLQRYFQLNQSHSNYARICKYIQLKSEFKSHTIFPPLHATLISNVEPKSKNNLSPTVSLSSWRMNKSCDGAPRLDQGGRVCASCNVDDVKD